MKESESFRPLERIMNAIDDGSLLFIRSASENHVNLGNTMDPLE